MKTRELSDTEFDALAYDIVRCLHGVPLGQAIAVLARACGMAESSTYVTADSDLFSPLRAKPEGLRGAPSEDA